MAGSNEKTRAQSLTRSKRTEHPQHLFALGESMGAGIALQSAGADSRIEAVIAEASFANLREAAYDYAGLRQYPWLGKTLFAPGAWLMVYRGEHLAGFPGAEVSLRRKLSRRGRSRSLLSVMPRITLFPAVTAK